MNEGRKSVVYEFRPKDPIEDCLRYNDGDWIPDDGEYDLAFVGRKEGFPCARYVSMPYQENMLWAWTANWQGKCEQHPNENPWHHMTTDGKDWRDRWLSHDERGSHPNVIAKRRAMAKCAQLYSCANGSGPQFQIGDGHIKVGLLRERKTKRVVKFPKTFICIYCGEVTIGEEKDSILDNRKGDVV